MSQVPKPTVVYEAVAETSKSAALSLWYSIIALGAAKPSSWLLELSVGSQEAEFARSYTCFRALVVVDSRGFGTVQNNLHPYWGLI